MAISSTLLPRRTEADFEPLVVFLDEYADFRGNLLAWYAEVKVKVDPTRPLALSRVSSIARKGRTSRVHMVFSTQRPDAEYFGGDTRDNRHVPAQREEPELSRRPAAHADARPNRMFGCGNR